jgi:hypothetical protein
MSLIAKLEANALGHPQWLLARCLAPGTTRAPIDAARFVRDVVAAFAVS